MILVRIISVNAATSCTIIVIVTAIAIIVVIAVIIIAVVIVIIAIVVIVVIVIIAIIVVIAIVVIAIIIAVVIAVILIAAVIIVVTIVSVWHSRISIAARVAWLGNARTSSSIARIATATARCGNGVIFLCFFFFFQLYDNLC